ncbi:autophagy protein atg9, partial [Tieghemiomyces parasiticus]
MTSKRDRLAGVAYEPFEDDNESHSGPNAIDPSRVVASPQAPPTYQVPPAARLYAATTDATVGRSPSVQLSPSIHFAPTLPSTSTLLSSAGPGSGAATVVGAGGLGRSPTSRAGRHVTFNAGLPTRETAAGLGTTFPATSPPSSHRSLPRGKALDTADLEDSGDPPASLMIELSPVLSPTTSQPSAFPGYPLPGSGMGPRESSLTGNDASRPPTLPSVFRSPSLRGLPASFKQSPPRTGVSAVRGSAPAVPPGPTVATGGPDSRLATVVPVAPSDPEFDNVADGPDWEPFATSADRDVEFATGLFPGHYGESSDDPDNERRPVLLGPGAIRRPRGRADTSQGPSAEHTAYPPLRNRFRRRFSTAEQVPLRDRVLRQWRDYANQDEFFESVYQYYAGRGAISIFLARFLNLLILGFVVAFTVFLFGCVDHSKLRSSKSLNAVIIPHCIYGFTWATKAVLLAFLAFYLLQGIQLVQDLRRLMEMRYFFVEVLGISNGRLQTCPWNEVVQKMIHLRDQDLQAMKDQAQQTLHSPAAQAAHARRLKNLRLTAHDVTNRIMRKENYMIALFNKDVVDIALPLSPWLPFAHWFRPLPPDPETAGTDPPTDRSLRPEYNNLSKALEWNLGFCLAGPVFDAAGQANRRVLRESYRAELSEALHRRFLIMGAVNLVLAPFIAVFLLLYFFFRYFDEIYKNPGSAVSRQYTPYARWKFRDFNELPHLFHARLSRSHAKANLYLTQFPQEVTRLLARFVAFVAGSFTAVLLVMTVVDHELSLEFEITPNKTVLFYIGLFGAVVAASRSAVPDEHLIYDPETALTAVLEDLHYLPSEWRNHLHTPEVRDEFQDFFDYKLKLYFRELFSVFTTPFVLWFSLAPSSGRIVDFFREFTVHVDGVGYVCSFAVFDFKRHGNAQYGAPGHHGDSRLASKEGKMEQSFINFKLNHPEWEPSDAAASAYLTRVQDTLQRTHQSQILRQHDTMLQSGLWPASQAGNGDPSGSLSNGSGGAGPSGRG